MCSPFFSGKLNILFFNRYVEMYVGFKSLKHFQNRVNCRNAISVNGKPVPNPMSIAEMFVL